MKNPFDLDQNDLDSLEASLEELLASNNGKVERAYVGELIKARFLSSNDRELYFDIGEKQEGICDRSEFDELPTAGEEFSVVILDRDGDSQPHISKKVADRQLTWRNIQDAYEAKANLSAIVSRVIPSGYLLDYKGLDLFMPLSQSNANSHLVEKLEIGKEIDFRVLELKEKFSSAIVSHRQVVEERNDSLWDQFLQNHEIGDIVEGNVVKKVSYGVFAEVESLMGLLHVSDISWKNRPSFKNKFHIKSKIKLKILKLDRENNRINLGLKQLTQEPWQWAEQELSQGQTIKAKVISLANYGAFLEIREGLEGLLHLSEISWDRKKRHPKQYLHLDQEIDVKILSMDVENRRISFSLKSLHEDPWQRVHKEIKVGDVCSGKVTGVTDFGTFVSIFSNIEGMIHYKDYNWDRNSANKKDQSDKSIFKKGQAIQFKILEINDKTKRIGCGYKQLTDSPHLIFKKENVKGTLLSGTIKKIAFFGILVRLDNGMEAIVPKAQIGLNTRGEGKENHEAVENVYKVGEKISAVLQDIDTQKNRIYLSIKAYNNKKEKDLVKQYTQTKYSPGMSTPFAELLAKGGDKA